MNIKYILIGMALILATTACANAGKLEEGTGQEDESRLEDKMDLESDAFLVPDDGPVTVDVIAKSLKNGRWVHVNFNSFTDGSEIWKCPVGISTVDKACADADFGITDTSVICRRPKDSLSHHHSLRKIKWMAADGVPFKVTFPAGSMPCGEDWGGSTYNITHMCKLKKGEDLNLGPGDVVILKYNIEVESERCNPLDPYFIVRK